MFWFLFPLWLWGIKHWAFHSLGKPFTSELHFRSCLEFCTQKQDDHQKPWYQSLLYFMLWKEENTAWMKTIKSFRTINFISCSRIVFLKKTYLVWILCMIVLSACMWAPHVCVPGTGRDHKRALNPFKPELWIIVSHHVGSGNQT